jgi:transcriptional regulator with XRE-family HTH domain
VFHDDAGVLVPRLHQLRDSRAFTQKELALLAGVSVSTIKRGEAGQHIRQTNVRRLARALGVTPARLQRPI